MTWQIALSLSIAANVCFSLIQRHYSQKHSVPNTFPPAIMYAAGVLPVGVVVGLSLPHHVHWTAWTAGLLCVLAVFSSLSNWLSFKAVRHLQVAQFQTAYKLYAVVTILLGWIVLGEKLTVAQIVGGVFLMAAAYVAIRAPAKTRKEARINNEPSAIILAVIGAICLGIALVAEKAALGHMDLGAYFIFGFGAQTLGLLILASKDLGKKNLRSVKLHDVCWSVGMGLTLAVTGTLYVTALSKAGNISLLTAVNSITLPLTVLAAYLFFHERDNQKLLWSSIGLALVGLLVMALF